MTELANTQKSPFDEPPNVGRHWLRRAAYGVLPLAALGAVFLVRDRSDEHAATDSAHDHGAAAAARDAGPVTLTPDAERRIGVTYTVATSGTLAPDIRTVGQVTFDETRVKAISPKVDGWVERLHVDFTGQPVRVGDPLLALYSPMLVAAQEELILAKRLASEVSAGTSDAIQGAQELLASARRRLTYWDVPPSEIERIERTGEVQRTITLRAAASGVVVEKLVLSGQRIMAGDALYRVADLSVVWVEGEVFEQDLAAVRIGLPAVAEFEAYPGEQWSGRIAYLYPTLNPETRTARVRVALANPGLRIKPGMYATLRFSGAAREDVLTVPRSAVLSTGERNLVFGRQPDGQLQPREVRIGAAAGERVEVLAGLTPGERVVASATFLVDAESNLGSALGGMGNMPGMDVTTPPVKAPPPATRHDHQR